jgi:hypothetical protein
MKLLLRLIVGLAELAFVSWLLSAMANGQLLAPLQIVLVDLLNDALRGMPR